MSNQEIFYILLIAIVVASTVYLIVAAGKDKAEREYAESISRQQHTNQMRERRAALYANLRESELAELTAKLESGLLDEKSELSVRGRLAYFNALTPEAYEYTCEVGYQDA